MANFAVRLVHGSGWDPLRQIRDQDGWSEHAAFMDGLVEDGFIILGGPIGGGPMSARSGRGLTWIHGQRQDCFRSER